MTSLNQAIPYNLPMSTAESVEEGYLLQKDSGNTLTLIDTVADEVIGVVDQTPTDAEQTARTTRAGEDLGVFLIGSGAIVNVASVSGDTYTLGDAVYGGQSGDTDGYCSNDTTSSATKIGHCVKAVTTASAGELIQVILDVAQIN